MLSWETEQHFETLIRRLKDLPRPNLRFWRHRQVSGPGIGEREHDFGLLVVGQVTPSVLNIQTLQERDIPFIRSRCGGHSRNTSPTTQGFQKLGRLRDVLDLSMPGT